MGKHRQLKRWVLFAVMLVIVLIINMPIISLMMNSLKTTKEMMGSSGFLPRNPTLINYEFLSYRTRFWDFFKNSMIVAACGTGLCVIGASLSGYALSRYRIAFTIGYSRLLLVMQMFPIILALIPLFIIFRTLGLVNTYYSVVLVYAAFQLPFATWMFKSFFDAIPRELEEAAQIDGCSKMQAFRHVVLPLCSAAFAAVTIFAFLLTYNEYLIANIFLRSEAVMTVPVGIQMFIQQYQQDLGNLMAAATLAMIPTFVLFLFVQKYMIYTAISGAVKG